VSVACVVEAKDKLGEVPVWDVREQALYWVDIEGKLLQRLTPATGEVKRWTMPERIACFALRESGGLIVAFASGLAFYDLDSGEIEWIAKPEAHIPTNRFNEGKCDRKGRFWAGTMDDRLAEHTGALYRVDPDSTVHKVLDGIGISNSTVWSLANDAFYFADTLDGVLTTHHGHMPEIEFTSPTTAEGIWSMEDMLKWPKGSRIREMHGYGHYHETYEKVGGAWRIKTLKLTRLRNDRT